MLRALRARNYRLFFTGQAISLIGTWLQQVALQWLVFVVTKSTWLVGVVAFAGQISAFILGPFAGVWSDHLDRRRLIIGTQALSMLQAGILGMLVLTHRIHTWHIITLASLLGIVNAFDIPARQSFVVDMIEDRSDLPNAIALNSSMFNGARLLGPAVAGMLLARVGAGWCFVLNSLSYVAVLISLVAMRFDPRPSTRRSHNVREELREGAAYVAGSPAIRALLLQIGILGLVAMPYTVLLPAYSAQNLHGGPLTFGLLQAAPGLGALAAALYLASRDTVVGLARVIAGGVLLYGLSLTAFAASHWLLLSLPMLVFAGLGGMILMASTNTILQTIVEENKRGRVMSFYMMAFMGTSPLGGLVFGALSDHVMGVALTLAVGGLSALAVGITFTLYLPRFREAIRPIYREMGILGQPEKAGTDAHEPKSSAKAE